MSGTSSGNDRGNASEATHFQLTRHSRHGTTHVEFNDVIDQVVRDGLAVHLVDNPLLRKQETERCPEGVVRTF